MTAPHRTRLGNINRGAAKRLMQQRAAAGEPRRRLGNLLVSACAKHCAHIAVASDRGLELPAAVAPWSSSKRLSGFKLLRHRLNAGARNCDAAADLVSLSKTLARNRKSCTGVAATKGRHLGFAPGRLLCDASRVFGTFISLRL
jgi:hypothetical protein